MKKITVTVDEAVLATVRRYAAEHQITVNALVCEYLNGLSAHQDRAIRARTELRELSQRSKFRLGRKTWSRGVLYR